MIVPALFSLLDIDNRLSLVVVRRAHARAELRDTTPSSAQGVVLMDRIELASADIAELLDARLDWVFTHPGVPDDARELAVG